MPIAKSQGKEVFAEGRYVAATYYYMQAKEIDPHDATVFSNLSLCLLRMREGEQALKYARECKTLRPDWFKAWYREGMALSFLKNYKGAVDALDQALKLDPANNEIKEALREDVMRKCKSMGNLAALGAGVDGGGGGADGGGAGDGYLSDGGLMQSSGKRRRAQERKKAVPWTEEEHRTFLAGLEKLGKGDWRGIAKNFVTTRTPTQVASHAQKYFLRQTNPNKKKRRSSLFDMMPRELSPTPNGPILPPSMAKVQDVVAMTKQLQNSNLEGASSSNAANVASQVGRDLPPVPSFKAPNMDSSFRKFSHMEPYWRTPYPFRPIPRAPEGTSSSTPVAANIAVPASQANLPACTSSFLSQRGDTSSLPPKGDPPSEEEDLELTVAPPSQQQNMTNMSSQNVVGVIQVI